jgi:hypothetical protein
MQKNILYKPTLGSQAHCQVAPAIAKPKPAKELAYPNALKERTTTPQQTINSSTALRDSTDNLSQTLGAMPHIRETD